MKLNLPKAVVCIRRDDKVIFFNADIPSWVVTDSEGERILSLCNGTMDRDEITTLFEEFYDKQAAEKVGRFLDYCISLRLFEIPTEGSIPILRNDGILNIVQFSISRKCNLNCKYCYATDRVESKFPPMSMSDYIRVVNEILDISNSVKFNLTGGEPLLNKDCLKIAQYIKSKGNYVDLLTNAVLINEQMADQIKDVFDRVTISMDGSTKALHESFRGHNTYDITSRNIEMLLSKGVDTCLSMTVNRLNIQDVPNMARKYGNLLSFAPLFPAGNARNLETDISISGKDYYKALSEADGVNPLSYCESSLDNSQICRNCKCAIGDSSLSISSTGDVYPCQLLHYEDFYMGNIHESSIQDLYFNSSIVEKCRHLTVDNIEGCSDCFLRYVCGGACRARAYHECGNIFKSGNFCEYEKNAFIDGLLNIYSKNLFE